MTDPKYPLPVGEADRLRLEILNKMYNPQAQHWLLQHGLREGMTALEIGCGAGDMVCWLSRTVGPSGKVVAVDNSENQINVAREKAQKQGLRNIEFHCLDLQAIKQLNQTFDFIYGRWVLMFLKDPTSALKQLYQTLNPSGILAIETIGEAGESYFSFPEFSEIKKWFEHSRDFFKQNNLSVNLGNRLFSIFHEIGLKNIALLANQPIMKTPQEKSVLRLSSIGLKEHFLKMMSTEEYNCHIDKLIEFEQSNSIGGFYRNIIAAGIK